MTDDSENDPYSWGDGANALAAEFARLGVAPNPVDQEINMDEQDVDLNNLPDPHLHAKIMLRPDLWPFFLMPLVNSTGPGCLMSDGQGEWIILRGQSYNAPLDMGKGETVSEGQLMKIVETEGWQIDG